MEHTPTQAKLTPQEAKILQLVSDGSSNKEIAQLLKISVRTVETHRYNIFRKLQVDNVAKMIRKGYQLQLL